MSNVNLGTIFERASKWNSVRYPRVYNHELSVNLLDEELNEYFEAESSVDQLDALCDLVFVSMGILWKTGIDIRLLDSTSDWSNTQATALLKANVFEPIHLVASVLIKYKYVNEEYPTALAVQTIITLCMVQMSGMGLNTEESLAALLIVCNSNDSKSIKKTEPHIKANGGDKGKDFVTPEPALLDLLIKMEKRHNGN